MKLINLLFLLTLTILSCNSQNEMSITTSNPINVKRTDALIRISKSKLTSDLASSSFIILYKNKEIPFQKEDTDNDGVWDNLILVSDFKANEVKKITIKKTDKETNYPKMTDVHFGVGNTNSSVSEVQEYERKGDPRTSENKKFFQMEGPAWENDKVGFRMYFDPRNGIDIFGKTTETPILSKVGIGSLSDYHTQKKWGMDILKVGQSLGAGSIALQQGDSLIRITGTSKATFKTITEGPIKASFKMIYTDTDFTGNEIEITHKIDIYKGQYFYESKILLPELSANTNLVAGIVNFKPNQMSTSKTDTMFSLSSYGKQSENNDQLGMAIITNKENVVSYGKVNEAEKDIKKTYFVQLKATKINRFYFFSGWEPTDTVFKNQKGFQKKLTQTLLEIANPIVVK